MTKETFNTVTTPETQIDTLTAVGFTTPILFCACDIALQLDGVATAVTAQVQRSVRNPSGADNAGGPAWAPVDVAVSGNAATGIVPVKYSEPGMAWWRVSVTALTGASVGVSLTGKGA
jgi:hypothetical protein